MKSISKQTLLCILLISALNAVERHYHYVNTNGKTFVNQGSNVAPHVHNLRKTTNSNAVKQPQYSAYGKTTFPYGDVMQSAVDNHTHPYYENLVNPQITPQASKQTTPQASKPTTPQAIKPTTPQAIKQTTPQARQAFPNADPSKFHFHYITPTGDKTYTNEDSHTIPHIHKLTVARSQLLQPQFLALGGVSGYLNLSMAPEDDHKHPFFPKRSQ